MPKDIERKLKAEARKKHLSQKATNRYVYGTLAKIEKRRHAVKRKKK